MTDRCDDLDLVIQAAGTIGTTTLADLRAAATHARHAAATLHIDTDDTDHLDADLTRAATLAIAAETLDLLTVYRTVQLWGGDEPIHQPNGEQHP